MELVIWLVVGLVVGGGIGALATWWISRARGGVVSVMQLKQENDRFRNEVTEHFVETARLINQMTDSYKQVFDHLSSGAEKLVDNKSLAERLPPASGQEVKLSQFGASASSGSTAGAASEPKSGTEAAGGAPEKKSDKTSENSAERPDPLKGKRQEDSSASSRGPDKAKSAPGAGAASGKTPAAGSASDSGNAKTADAKPAAGGKSSGQTGEKSAGKD